MESLSGLADERDDPETSALPADYRIGSLPPSWYSDCGVVTAMAPMVGQSDLPFRMLARRYGCSLVYTEMLVAEEFAADPGYRMRALGEAVRSYDHPLLVQFAANSEEHFVAAALHAQAAGADGVDLNLGCPQRRAKESHYGAYMTDPEDWELCCSIVRAAAAHPELRIPVTVKIRLQPRLEDTCNFACMLAEAGARLVAVHGRMRGSEDRRRDGSADLHAVSEVVRVLRERNVPVLTNGNVREPDNVIQNLSMTRAEGIMVAEQLLRDPALFFRAGLCNDFAPSSSMSDGTLLNSNVMTTRHDDDCHHQQCSRHPDSGEAAGADDEPRHHQPAPLSCIKLASEYVELVQVVSACSERVLKSEDGTIINKQGQVTRAGRDAEDGEEEFERLSVWWANAEVVKSHLKEMLGDRGALVSRSTFKKAATVDAAIRCFKARFRL